MKKYAKKDVSVNGVTFSFETGKLANQANGAVFAKMGETVVLATVVSAAAREGIDFFPLSVEYQERHYASGMISSSRFSKREGRPSDEEILKSRLIDRSLRPLFKEDFINELQIITTVMSYDGVNDPSILAINAASAALLLAGVPFEGPVAGVRIGKFGDELRLNPSMEEMKDSEMDLFVSGTKDAIIMLEAGAKEVPEETILQALEFAHKSMQPLIEMQTAFQKEADREALSYTPRILDETILTFLEKDYGKKIKETSYIKEKAERDTKWNAMKEEIYEKYLETYSQNALNECLDHMQKKLVRKEIIETGARPDGRKTTEIRPISIEVGVLPRTHGSAMFQRGETQAISIVTLGSGRQAQLMQSIEGEETKRYIHHYNFPGWSVGEVSRANYYPGRREIGHGALAERALVAVLPSQEEFPYTIRVVSEIMSSNGSTSMASTCGSTLSLMDAGVPIKAMVSGIAMGLVMDEKTGKYAVLSDIQGLEDHFGDMDFKVTGTTKGVTAIQMDNKLKGISIEILRNALGQAREGRLFIMDKMKAVITEPRKSLSKYAPQIEMIKIPQDKIGEVIGPQGKNIKKIIEDTGAEIEIGETGDVSISAVSEESRESAKRKILAFTEVAEVGKIYEGTVSKLMAFGAFVDVSPSISGLVHVSEMAEGFVKDPSKVVKEGQTVKVMITGIDEQGRINMSMKRASKQD
jgi:polyribonucleotide nucleotidyltransferase